MSTRLFLVYIGVNICAEENEEGLHLSDFLEHLREHRGPLLRFLQ